MIMLTPQETFRLNHYKAFIEFFGVSEMTDPEFEDYMRLFEKSREGSK